MTKIAPKVILESEKGTIANRSHLIMEINQNVEVWKEAMALPLADFNCIIIDSYKSHTSICKAGIVVR